MGLSNSKIIHLSKVIIHGLQNLEGVGFKKDLKDIQRVIEGIIHEELQKEYDIEQKVHNLLDKNTKLKKGTREYEDEFQKLLDIEMKKKGLKS